MSGALHQALEPGRESPWKMVAALAGALCALLLLLGWLGTSAVPVSEDRFVELLQVEMITKITVGGDGLEAELCEPVRIGSEGRDAMADKVYLECDASPIAADVTDWELRGITVVVRGPGEQRARDVAGATVVFLLLGIGVWHLWTQIREDRHGAGSPRRRLKELEVALADGVITQEEFSTRSQAVWAEM